MPKGYKIESEMNLLKDDESKNKISKNKKNKRHSSIVIIEKKSARLHKPKIKEDLGYIDKDVIMGKSNPLRVSISKQCDIGLTKIKKIPFWHFFYTSRTLDAPSLSKIEKNIKNYKYQSTYEFIMDLRRLWNYYFQNYHNQPDIFQKVSEMSKSSEEILNEFDIFSEDKGEMKEITKKIDSLERELKDIKGNNNNNNFNYNIIKRISTGEKAMSYDEKATLRNNIKLLNPEQKKGIVNILNDNSVDLSNKKYFELDIEKLGNKKLRELDNYVQGCIRKNRLSQNNNNNEFSEMQKLKTELGGNKIIQNDKNEKPNEKKEEEILDDLSSSESDSNSLSSLI